MIKETIPQEAHSFRMEPGHSFQLEQPDGEGRHRVRLTAFTGDPVTHWWWGRCVFDRSGFTASSEKIPIDYNHKMDDAIGWLETFSGEKELVCEGWLVPYPENKSDRASEIIYKAKQGQPYQCSVMVGDYLDIEEVPEKYTAEVNGMTVEGPVVIYRKYTIAGVAICPYGTDANTSTTVFNKGKPMAIEKKETDENPGKPAEPDGRELFKTFCKKYGKERAANYFADGLDEEQADDKFIEESASEIETLTAKVAELTAENETLTAKIAELEAQIAGSGAGTEGTGEKEEFRRWQQAGKGFNAEGKPVSGNTAAPAAKKTYSPLGEGATAEFAKKIAKTEAFQKSGMPSRFEK
ncbi:MAG: hypothetical protein LBQ54_00885 [Planctomycetaceae bacterium]|nr:hypothetical protein [Planctomycetaceae bacterium]